MADAEKQPLNNEPGSDKSGQQRLYPDIKNSDSAPVVVVTRPEDVDTVPTAANEPPQEKPSVYPAIGLSCFVFWCCPGCLLPFAAFIFAGIAACVKKNKTASQFILASFGLSIAGITCGAIAYIIISGFYIAQRDQGLNKDH